MSYIPQTKKDVSEMLESLKISSVEELFKDIPDQIKNPNLNLQPGMDEIKLVKKIKDLSYLQKTFPSFLGAGAYNHYVPAVVGNIISRNEFLTAYTPYQPEMSQGILQAIFEYQTMICALTGLDVSNASLYDGATAIWEAILMSVRTTKRNEIIVCEPINPQYKKVIQTYARFAEIKVNFIKQKSYRLDLEILKSKLSPKTASVVIQYPNFLGVVENLTQASDAIKNNGSIFIANVNPIALGLFETPAQMGAEIIVGDGQSLGIPLSFGGPYVGFICAKEKFLRQMPGRIVGQTKDLNGKKGYVLTIQTREQHIRREKATSNICSNQALMALAVSVYLSYMGKQGLHEIAKRCYNTSVDLRKELSKFKNLKIENTEFFNEFPVTLPVNASKVLKLGYKKQIIAGYPLNKYDSALKNELLVCVTELTIQDDIEKLISVLGNV